jgi:hypothetical protein
MVGGISDVFLCTLCWFILIISRDIARPFLQQINVDSDSIRVFWGDLEDVIGGIFRTFYWKQLVMILRSFWNTQRTSISVGSGSFCVNLDGKNIFSVPSESDSEHGGVQSEKFKDIVGGDIQDWIVLLIVVSVIYQVLSSKFPRP